MKLPGDAFDTIDDDTLAIAHGGVNPFGLLGRHYAESFRFAGRTMGNHYAQSGRTVGQTMGRAYGDAGRALVEAYRW
jgi:hypothetical protein